MKKIAFYCLLSSFIAANSWAQAVDLFDDSALDKEDSANVAGSAESAEEESQGFFSFITKPLSLLFSANDKVPTPDGKEETFLERSIRQANEGKIEDQMNLAYMYLYGTNGVQKDSNKAFEYYQMAAEQNNPIALNNLGSLYFNGIGTNPDVKKAVALFTKAAELGNDNAAINLAFIYLKGGTRNQTRNETAMDLFKKGQVQVTMSLNLCWAMPIIWVLFTSKTMTKRLS